MRLELVGCFQMLPQNSMVVYFAIDGERQGSILIDQGLGSGICEQLVWNEGKERCTHRRPQYLTAHGPRLANDQPPKQLYSSFNSLVLFATKLPPRVSQRLFSVIQGWCAHSNLDLDDGHCHSTG